VNHREDDNTLFGQEIEEVKTTRDRRVTNGAKVGRDGSGGGTRAESRGVAQAQARGVDGCARRSS
jgi:hypothetical protein